jgi:acyl dehydratase
MPTTQRPRKKSGEQGVSGFSQKAGGIALRNLQGCLPEAGSCTKMLDSSHLSMEQPAALCLWAPGQLGIILRRIAMSGEKAWPQGPPQVGQRAERTREVTLDDILLFTAISGDRNPLHYDEEAAKKTKFGRIVVQGGVISAILNAVVAEELPGPGTVFLHVDWSFKAPVHPGDVITGIVEIIHVRDEKPITEVKTTVIRQDGTVALEGKALCYTMPIHRSGD